VRLKLLVPALLAGLLWAVPALAQGPTADGVASKLVCQCGCGSVLTNCPHVECGSRAEMYASINQTLSRGLDEPQIVQAMVLQYGEQVLAAPTKKGFNLTAWLTPIAFLLAGGVALYFLLKLWVGRGRAPVPVSTVPPGEEEKYRQRLEQELKNFGEGVR